MVAVIESLADAFLHGINNLNASVLGILKDTTLGNLFWTMMLTGSTGVAALVVCISYAVHIGRTIYSYIP